VEVQDAVQCGSRKSALGQNHQGFGNGFIRQIALAEDGQSAIIDRSIYEDAFIFARALYEMGHMTERDYLSYRRLFDVVVGELPLPDLLIYLRAPVSVLLERIGKRGRAIESGISADYLSLLDRYYDEWLKDFAACPVLMIESGNLDFAHRADHLDVVVARIEDRLSGKERLVFPN
jgi:deoxyadenosine/deoxycytidine kinase